MIENIPLKKTPVVEDFDFIDMIDCEAINPEYINNLCREAVRAYFEYTVFMASIYITEKGADVLIEICDVDHAAILSFGLREVLTNSLYSDPDMFSSKDLDVYRKILELIETQLVKTQECRQDRGTVHWGDISTAPKDGKEILLGRKSKTFEEKWKVCVSRFKNGRWTGTDASLATHWAPLPGAPEGEER